MRVLVAMRVAVIVHMLVVVRVAVTVCMLVVMGVAVAVYVLMVVSVCPHHGPVGTIESSATVCRAGQLRPAVFAVSPNPLTPLTSYVRRFRSFCRAVD